MGRGKDVAAQELREITPDATIVVDDRGRICELDQLAERMFGHRRSQALGHDLPSLILSPELCSRYQDALARAQTAGRGPILCRLELAGLRADGISFPLEISVARSSSGPAGMLTLLLRDLSARRASEDRLAHSEALLAEAEVIGGFGSFELDLHSGFLDPSENLLALLGHAGGGLTLRALLNAFDDPAREALAGAIGAARKRQRSFDLRLRLRDGQRVLRARGRAVRPDGNRAAKVVATLQDVTEEINARSTREFLGHIVSSSLDAIYTKSAEGTITSWNRGAELLYGFTAEEAIGASMDLIVPPAQREEQFEMLRTVLDDRPIVAVESTRMRKDGTTVEVSISLSPVHDAEGQIVAVAVIAHDVTEQKRYQERLQHLADHDPLTDLLNRRRFEQALQLELERARRYGNSGAVLILDVDGLKAVNDTGGHAAGDALIIQVARTLQSGSRASDVVARLGGDEFGILLPAGSSEQAEAAAAHLLEQLRAEPLVIGGLLVPVRASIGVAPFTAEHADAAEVIAAADLALYDAKSGGRNRAVVATPAQATRAREQSTSAWTPKIQRALERDAFEAHWQPIVDLGDRRVRQAELLVRMKADDGTLVGPAAFLPAAARHGLIEGIDRWMLRRAIRILHDAPPEERVPLALNLSSQTLAAHEDLPAHIEKELRGADLDPGLLVFEVSEMVAVGNLPQVREFAEGMRQLGCGVALDHFGTSLGSLRYLRHLPITQLKLEAELIQNLLGSPMDESIVRAIVEIARGIGARTVAERVGDEPTAELLRRYGVDYGQGFHLGVPRSLRRPRPTAGGRRRGGARPTPTRT